MAEIRSEGLSRLRVLLVLSGLGTHSVLALTGLRVVQRSLALGIGIGRNDLLASHLAQEIDKATRLFFLVARKVRDVLFPIHPVWERPVVGEGSIADKVEELELAIAAKPDPDGEPVKTVVRERNPRGVVPVFVAVGYRLQFLEAVLAFAFEQPKVP